MLKGTGYVSVAFILILAFSGIIFGELGDPSKREMVRPYSHLSRSAPPAL
jgi:hypothetical protein